MSKWNHIEGLMALGVKRNTLWIDEFNMNFIRLVDAGIARYLIR